MGFLIPKQGNKISNLEYLSISGRFSAFSKIQPTTLFMKAILKIEEVAMFALSLWAFHLTGVSWWWFAGLFFLPDIGMLGYALGEKTGAVVYNLFHHKGIALVIFGLGIFLSLESLEIAGIILFSHSSFDRILGYGLKFEKGFKFTHLGEIGNGRKE